MVCLLFCTMFLTGCSLQDSSSTNKLLDNKSSEVSTQSYDVTSQQKADTQNSDDTSKQQVATKNSSENSKQKIVPSKDNTKNKVSSEQNITEKVKDYIIKGQENKSEAEKIKWSKTFLNRVDIESLYKKYLANGGKAGNLQSFANYMTLNAPIASDWKKLFEKDLYDTYGEKVVRVEQLKGDLYQAYIKKDGKEIAYVVVSSRTGYFHG